jgi:hypothetical protein
MWVSLEHERATPELVYDLATHWMRHAPLDVRIAAEQAELDDDTAREVADTEQRYNVVRSGTVRRDSGVEPTRAALPRRSG